jgi:hypothetical protein
MLIYLAQHNPEEVKAKMETLSEIQLQKAKFIEQSRERLRELSVPVRCTDLCAIAQCMAILQMRTGNANACSLASLVGDA